MKEVVVISALRTPIGSFQGSLSKLSASQLGATVIRAILEKTKIEPSAVDEVVFGDVLTAGIGQAPARQAALYGGLPESVECMTINKVCGSGLKAIMLAQQAIQVGDADVIIAGGMESMSNVPYYLPGARGGQRLGHGKMVDGMIHDGLWDPYDDKHMGNCAETCAREKSFTREEQDDFAEMSYKRSQEAQKSGYFADEIAPVTIKSRRAEITVSEDDEPMKVNFEKMRSLRPAFEKEGTITAANASKINDGAAAVLLMSREKCAELGFQPMATLGAQASVAQMPEWFTTAPINAIEKVCKKESVAVLDIELFEINEAFSVVTLAALRELEIPVERVNIHGGAVSLGHPIGASGARVFVTLLHAMKRIGAKTGLATLCIGGGEAAALIAKM